MLLHVQIELFDSIKDNEEIMEVRKVLGERFKIILTSGKVQAGGIYSDARGGFLLVKVDSAEELFDLLGPAIIDHAHIETHPVISFEYLGEFFKKESIV